MRFLTNKWTIFKSEFNLYCFTLIICGLSRGLGIIRISFGNIWFRHGKSGDLGDPGSQKNLHIVEDLNQIQKNLKEKQKSIFSMKIIFIYLCQEILQKFGEFNCQIAEA